MSIVINLPMDLEQKLMIEAKQERVAPAEQAGLLLCVASVLRLNGPETEFGSAVRSFLRQRQVDPDRLAEALEQLKVVCFKSKVDPSAPAPPGADPREPSERARLEGVLRRWRDGVVHRPIEDGATPPADVPFRQEPSSIRGKYAYLGLSSEDYAREKQLEIDREDRI